MKRMIPALMVARRSWVFFRTITFDLPASNLTNFPALISGTYTYLKTVANGGLVKNSSGYDIIFYADKGLRSKLSWEVEKYDATTGEIIAWVKIPVLSATVATVIYMSYGDPSITTDQSSATGTWNSNYLGVYHLPDGTTLSVVDSTAAHNGTNNGATAVAGEIDGGANFVAASSQYVDLGSGILFSKTTPFSVECWINTSLAASGQLMTNYNVNAGSPGWEFLMGSTGVIYLILGNSNVSAGRGKVTTGAYNDGAWRHIVATYDGSNTTAGINIYVNGSSVATTNVFDTDPGTLVDANTLLGAQKTAGVPAVFYTGKMDEARISNVAYSVDWIAAEYSNQNDPTNFYVVGEQDIP